MFGHQDASGENADYQQQLLRRAIVLEYDGFGYEMRTDAYGGLEYPTEMPSSFVVAVLRPSSGPDGNDSSTSPAWHSPPCSSRCRDAC
jgi:hypothetical protein